MDNSKKNRKVSKKSDSEYKKFFLRRTVKFEIAILIVFVLLIGRLAWIQFVNGSEYKEYAYEQQTMNQIISPKRGTIYDSTGQPLAISADVDTVTINPSEIEYENGNKVEPEKIAKAFSDIFALDYNEVLEKVNSDSMIETIARKVENDKITLLENWLDENDVTSGVNIDDDTKRYYPHEDLASQVIGFCGTDSQGLEGLESYWDSVLTGTPGKTVYSKSVINQEIPETESTYIDAENGSDLVLTLDINIQEIAEKYLEQAVKENKCTRGGNVIIMDPSTGDILAMATYPNYNLNTPFEPYTDSLKESWETLSSEERVTALQNTWKNRAVSDGYEPGSTFKLVTASIALEEGLVQTDIPNDFTCNIIENVDGVEISCWRTYGAHHGQSLREALGNSCNPAFIQLGRRIGAETFYKYFNAFGFFDTLNSGLSGEVSRLFSRLR